MALDPVADHLAIERLHYDYVSACDRPDGADAVAVSEYFTEDARWEAPDFDKVCVGRAEIVEQFSTLVFASPMHHFITNVRIDIAGDGLSAAATAYLFMFSRMKADDRLVTRASRYATTCVKRDGAWLFDSLAIVFQYGDPIVAN